MWQEKNKNSAKMEKFEDGVLRVDACFERHSLPRRYQYQFPYEDISSSFGRSALWEERDLLNKVAKLRSKGLFPHSEQTLEEFVSENYRFLEEVIK